jgi:hypothetical protein
VPSHLIPVLESAVESLSELADLRGTSENQRRKRFNYYDVVLPSLLSLCRCQETQNQPHPLEGVQQYKPRGYYLCTG